MSRAPFFQLRNQIRNYDWGSQTALAGLRGDIDPSVEPEAELWIGAHPSAASKVLLDGDWQPLDEVLQREATEFLGPSAVARFGPRMPFLLKILAIEAPLSLQAHPSAERALRGFDRENRAQLALDAPSRCYRDDNPKPEIVVALTAFRALRGLRSAAEIEHTLTVMDLGDLLPSPVRRALGYGNSRKALTTLLAGDARRAIEVVDRVLEKGVGPEVEVVRTLASIHPRDPAVLSPLFMELIELQPGEAMFTPPGILHAYLNGMGVELMASSDNVVRAGLTSKWVDLEELVSILSPKTRGWRVETVESGVEFEFRTPSEAFRLSRFELPAKEVNVESQSEVEILLCTAGECLISDPHLGYSVALRPTESVLVPASTRAYRLAGRATVFRARQGLCFED